MSPPPSTHTITSPIIVTSNSIPTPFHVLIVGGGIGGLAMGVLLHRAGISFDIYERTSAYRVLGSAIVLGANVLALFEQIGIYEDILKVSLPPKDTNIMDQNLKPIGSVDISEGDYRYGYAGCFLPRHELHRVLLSRVPPERLHLGKKVVSILQNEQGAMIRFSDGTTADGDIIVGADGAYSAIRQNMYATLQARASSSFASLSLSSTSLSSSSGSKLSKDDLLPLAFSDVTLLGTTTELDPEKYPLLKKSHASFEVIIGDNSHTWCCFTMPKNTVAWMVTKHLDNKTLAKDSPDNFRLSEWSPEAAYTMCGEVRDFVSPIGGTMGDLIDKTPVESISKVMLEEKLFVKWFECRTILVGDACHKMLPSAGLGAATAIMDVVSLANQLHELKDSKIESITAAFEAHYKDRFPLAAAAVRDSKQLNRVFDANGKLNKLVRNIVLNHLPKWLYYAGNDKTLKHRPQVTFLPFIPNRGKVKPVPQVQSKRLVAQPKAPPTIMKPTVLPTLVYATPSSPNSANNLHLSANSLTSNGTSKSGGMHSSLLSNLPVVPL